MSQPLHFMVKAVFGDDDPDRPVKIVDAGQRSYSGNQLDCTRVMNRVVSRTPLDEARFAQVRAAFATAFPQLAAATPVIDDPGNGPFRRALVPEPGVGAAAGVAGK